jgi:ADP-glucose pyrophosphorylase
MDGTVICEGSKINMTIIDEEVVIGKDAIVGGANDPEEADKKIAVIGRGSKIAPGDVVPAGKEVRNDS